MAADCACEQANERLAAATARRDALLGDRAKALTELESAQREARSAEASQREADRVLARASAAAAQAADELTRGQGEMTTRSERHAADAEHVARLQQRVQERQAQARQGTLLDRAVRDLSSGSLAGAPRMPPASHDRACPGVSPVVSCPAALAA